MNVAIVHDVYIEHGGAERVLTLLLSMYPHADIYIPLITKQNMQAVRRQTSGSVYDSWMNHIPFIHKASILVKPLLYLYWEQLNFSTYDLVISSSHSYSSKSVITPRYTKHVAYIYTPPRYLYKEFNETQILRNPFFRWILSPLLFWLRGRDYVGAQRPDIMIAISKIVQQRIWNYYGRKSVIVYPPVFIPSKILIATEKKYFLCFSRLAKQKGIDLAIRVCTKHSLPLLVVGTGSEESYLRSIAGPTVPFKGFIPDKEIKAIFASAKALIYPSIEEDFGIVPVEAMAHGVPVIGYASGGVLETVVHQKTGILFPDHTEASLYQAIQQLTQTSINSKDCIRQARNFSEQRFQAQMKKVVSISFHKERKIE
jgi:glycosyltransferase involved in cell wall biosynthesis